MWLRRLLLILPFSLAVLWAQFRDSGSPELRARLELQTEPLMPARVYLFKDDRPFRLSPVGATLPLNVDLFYRERLWSRTDDPETLEVTCNDRSHFILLKGQASFDLPAGKYKIEAYRGFFYVPHTEEFELRAGETRRIALPMKNWAGSARDEWISGDDHIHITRSRADNAVFLRWLEAEDLQVGNFLQLQRQMDAAVQYAFGREGEAQRAGYSIRSGHESRSAFYGHLNLLGGREMIRPLSIGETYANSAEAYPYPAVLFRRGRALGATMGYAHFNGGMEHSTLLMDLVLGNIDFVEVFQFGVMRTKEWYELLNAGLRVHGVAGSDFPVPLNRRKEWPRWLPLLGPERTLVRTDSRVRRKPTETSYDSWAAGVRAGDLILTNGPLVEVTLSDDGSTALATARFYRPLERLSIIRNGETVASVAGNGVRTTLELSINLDEGESCWVAAHVVAQKAEGEPDIQAHTNPAYLIREGKPVMIDATRKVLTERWEAELDYYKSAGLLFLSEAQKQEFVQSAERALAELRRPLGSGR